MSCGEAGNVGFIYCCYNCSVLLKDVGHGIVVEDRGFASLVLTTAAGSTICLVAVCKA